MLAGLALRRPEHGPWVVRRKDTNGALGNEGVHMATPNATVVFKVTPILCIVHRRLIETCLRGFTYKPLRQDEQNFCLRLCKIQPRKQPASKKQQAGSKQQEHKLPKLI